MSRRPWQGRALRKRLSPTTFFQISWKGRNEFSWSLSLKALAATEKASWNVKSILGYSRILKRNLSTYKMKELTGNDSLILLLNSYYRLNRQFLIDQQASDKKCKLEYCLACWVLSNAQVSQNQSIYDRIFGHTLYNDVFF